MWKMEGWLDDGESWAMKSVHVLIDIISTKILKNVHISIPITCDPRVQL